MPAAHVGDAGTRLVLDQRGGELEGTRHECRAPLLGQRQRLLGSEEERLTLVAQSILSTLEAAMLVARPYRDMTRFDAATKQLVDGLVA